jgi:hypothetical protein
MKKVIRKYGIYGFFSSIILFLIAFVIAKSYSYEVQEIVGYLTIVIALFFVFFAIKHYRDKENQGVLTIGNGILIGLSITTFVALGSAIADYIYVTILYPDFVTDYSNYQLEKLKSTQSARDFEIKRQEMMEGIKTIGNPFIMALVMFVTVMILGTIITLLSSLFLHNKNVVTE